jgi:hypothetical protein
MESLQDPLSSPLRLLVAMAPDPDFDQCPVPSTTERKARARDHLFSQQSITVTRERPTGV